MAEQEIWQDTTPDEWTSFRAFLLGRSLLIAAVLTWFGVVGHVVGSTTDMAVVVSITLLELGLTVPFYFLARRNPNWVSSLALWILVNDVTFVSLGMYFVGGDGALSGVPVYLVLVAMAAVLHSPRSAYVIAALASIEWFLVVTAVEVGWLPEREGAYALSFSSSWPWAAVILNALASMAIAGASGWLSDVTRRALSRSRHLEGQLRELNRGLEDRVSDATAALRDANTSLERKNRDLARTLRQVDLCARVISHDLRSPVAAAGEALRLAVEKDVEARTRLMNMASDNLMRVDRMLEGLRDVMRTVGSSSENEVVDLRELVEEVVEELRLAYGGGVLPVRLSGAFGKAQAQRDRLAHVFRNLIRNAVDHNQDQEDLLIEVGQEAHGEEMAFFVRDNGVGIPYEVQGRIFEPFHRGPHTSADGLGLGLALVYAIVDHAGGKIWLESRPGVGTIFRFTYFGAQREWRDR